MALTFPNNPAPSEGDVFRASNDTRYVYQGGAWRVIDGAFTHNPGPNPPAIPEIGDLWVDTSACPPILKVWDGDCDGGGGKWVPIEGGSSGPTPPPSIITTPTILSPDDGAGLVDVTRNPLTDEITANNKFTAGPNDWEPATPFRENVVFTNLEFSGKNWVAWGRTTGDVAISADGVNWTFPTVIPNVGSGAAGGLATDGNGTLLATFTSVQNKPFYTWSYDHGVTWSTPVELPPSGNSNNCWNPAYNNGVWIIPMANSAYYMSTNANSFGNLISVPGGSSGSNFFDVAGDGSSTWIGCMNSGEMCRSTNNGSSFSKFNISGWDTGGGGNALDVHYANGMWITVGNSGSYATSSNGTSWSSRKVIPSGSAVSLKHVKFGNNTWYVIGGGTYWTSTDNLSSFTGPYPLANFSFSNINYRPDRAEFIATGTITSSSVAGHTFISQDRSELTLDGETDLDLFDPGDMVELDTDPNVFGRVVQVIKNGTNSEIDISPYVAAWSVGGKVKNRKTVVDSKPSADNLVFTATPYADDNGLSAPAQALWEVKKGDSDFDTGTVMSASKAISDKTSNNTLDLGLGEGTARGNIVLEKDETYHVRVTYSSNTPQVLDSKSNTHVFKTDPIVRTIKENALSYYSEHHGVVDQNYISSRYGVEGAHPELGIYELESQPTEGATILGALRKDDKYRLVEDLSSVIADLKTQIQALQS